jgi:hypothetical protein
MNFAEKVFNLRNEIITDIKELVLKHGIITDTGKHSLDCWGYRMANSLITIHFVEYSPILGLCFDMGDDALHYQSELTIEEIANLADILHLYYKE